LQLIEFDPIILVISRPLQQRPLVRSNCAIETNLEEVQLLAMQRYGRHRMTLAEDCFRMDLEPRPSTASARHQLDHTAPSWPTTKRSCRVTHKMNLTIFLLLTISEIIVSAQPYFSFLGGSQALSTKSDSEKLLSAMNTATTKTIMTSKTLYIYASFCIKERICLY
jgi:hypothetical protein